MVRNGLSFFCPRDNTPGCTTEACGFRDNIKTVEKKDAVVVLAPVVAGNVESSSNVDDDDLRPGL